MRLKSSGWAVCLALVASALFGCGQKVDTAAEKAVADANEEIVVDAQAAAALVDAFWT